jgi:hypothetical protein
MTTTIGNLSKTELIRIMDKMKLLCKIIVDIEKIIHIEQKLSLLNHLGMLWENYLMVHVYIWILDHYFGRIISIRDYVKIINVNELSSGMLTTGSYNLTKRVC